MSVTEQQKAYHSRKVRTYLTRMDVNKDGFLSRDNYELMAKQLANMVASQKNKLIQHIVASWR